MARKKSLEVQKLTNKLIQCEAYDIGRLKRSYSQVEKCSQDHCMASGVIITITRLDGEVIVDPTLIADGLSKELLEALEADIAQTQFNRIKISAIKEI